MTRDILLQQLDTAWKLLSYHLEGLGEDECMWRPAAVGLHVVPDADGSWRVDWPAHEGYGIGPPSIAWVLWHIIFWWSMACDHAFGAGTLARQDVGWPGSAQAARAAIVRLHDEWRSQLEGLTDEDLESTARTYWPFSDRPFGHVVAWATLELTKNAAEVGYARFLHASRTLPAGSV